MTAPFTAHSKCRLCDSGNIEEVLDLGYSPLANAYLTEAQLTEVRSGKREEIFTPLRLLLCMECGCVQLAHSVDPAVLFTDYIYASSTSPVFVKHFEDFAKHVQELGLVQPNDLVVDIGSNDGIALKAFKSIGCEAIGIEPSRTLAEMAHKQGLATTIGFFDVTLAKSIASCSGKAQVITATNVFAHLSDLRGFVEGVLELLAADGVFIFEVSYLGDVVEHMLFDTIYMEHQFYHSVGPLALFLFQRGLPMFRAERINTHGGSIRIFADRGRRPNDGSPGIYFTPHEHSLGLKDPRTYRQFADRLQCYKHRLHSVIKPYRQELFAWGCPAKFTTFNYVLELNDVIRFAIDDSPLKANHFTPGSHIPIRSPFTYPNIAPEGFNPVPWAPLGAAIVSAWNFFDAIHAKRTGWAKPWIRPLPNLEVINV